MPYTRPILLTGDTIARMPDRPTQRGNKGDADFGMQITDAIALGTEDCVFRLVWHGNQNSNDVTFMSGQVWRLEKCEPDIDDSDPNIDDGSWVPVLSYQCLLPQGDCVSGLGAGSDYIVLENQGGCGGYLIFDIDAEFSSEPQNLFYSCASSGELTFT